MYMKIRKVVRQIFLNQETTHKLLNEILWAQRFHDSIRGKSALESQNLYIGRWAGNYTLFYIINKVLSDYKPPRILELGLGESSKFISTYVRNYLNETTHHIVEHDANWVEIFNKSYELYSKSEIITCPLTKRSIKGHLVNSYSDFKKNVHESYDLYLVDGPFGSEPYSRYDIISLVEEFTIDSEFIIIFDDYNRIGEKNTVDDLLSILKNKNIDFINVVYSGQKSVAVIASNNYRYLSTL